MSSEQDDIEDASAGKLGRSAPAVKQLFDKIDAAVARLLGAVDRRRISRAGEWYGRSYFADGRCVLRIDPKRDALRIWVGKELYGRAPSALRGHYRQDDWLIATPETEAAIMTYLPAVLANRRR